MFEPLLQEGSREIGAMFVFVYTEHVFNMCECRAAGWGHN